jgi:hypothetical protein
LRVPINPSFNRGTLTGTSFRDNSTKGNIRRTMREGKSG